MACEAPEPVASWGDVALLVEPDVEPDVVLDVAELELPDIEAAVVAECPAAYAIPPAAAVPATAAATSPAVSPAMRRLPRSRLFMVVLALLGPAPAGGDRRLRVVVMTTVPGSPVAALCCLCGSAVPVSASGPRQIAQPAHRKCSDPAQWPTGA